MQLNPFPTRRFKLTSQRLQRLSNGLLLSCALALTLYTLQLQHSCAPLQWRGPAAEQACHPVVTVAPSSKTIRQRFHLKRPHLHLALPAKPTLPHLSHLKLPSIATLPKPKALAQKLRQARHNIKLPSFKRASANPASPDMATQQNPVAIATQSSVNKHSDNTTAPAPERHPFQLANIVETALVGPEAAMAIAASSVTIVGLSAIEIPVMVAVGSGAAVWCVAQAIAATTL